MKNYNDLVKLIADVNARKILDTSDAAICDYQDMIAHSNDDQLAELANDDKTRFAFYWIYSQAYRAESLLAFYAKHDAKIYELRVKAAELEDDLTDAKELIQTLKNEIADLKETGCDEYEMRVSAENENERLKSEIIELKAKLYDLMTK